MELQEKIQYISEALDAFLLEGITYYSSPIVREHGTSGGSFYILKDGKVDYDFEGEDDLSTASRRLGHDSDLFSISVSYPEHTKLRYQFEKGKLLTYKVYDVPMLLEDIKREYLFDKQYYEVQEKIETIRFTQKGGKIKVSVKEITTYPNKIHKGVSNRCMDEIICLYHLLEEKPKVIQFNFDGEDIQIYASFAMTEYGIESLDNVVDFSDFNPEDLNSIYSYLESYNDAKIDKALSVLKDQEIFKAKAEQRYLEFIKTRLNSNKVSIFDFKAAAPTQAEVAFFLSKDRWIISKKTKKQPRLAKLSFSYCDEEESKWIVDVIGGLTKQHNSLRKFTATAMMTSKEAELEPLVKANYEALQLHLKEALTTYDKGWYGTLVRFILELPPVHQVLFEKTSFLDANASLALKEFMFFLLLNSQETSLYFDVFQSDAPELTDLFWMFKKVPESNWSDGVALIPDRNRLKYKRTAYYKTGDASSWQFIDE